ncbi:hypothetical protein [Streptomyces nymphaeiformis]|uniref:HK97 gp10 family phage protein n=1 Tax=Streptomyces nymphaeiformis TaxID=2663842 RepID=A0A7W7U527_9ACTN|nr:hypothetical protein [Streptomyces nymphaeiformis]MBB4985033.1 hypothetical protein [Streptomyces nymphaeiformis]
MSDIDVRELVQLAAVLQENLAEAEPQMAAIVTRGALNVKNAWRANAIVTAGRHARRYPYSIGYDVTPIPGGATAEIGPDKGKVQGPLGNLLEFGSSNNPPHNDGGRALLAEAPAFEAHVAALVQRLGPA